jgi:hypothetical protein
VLAGLLPGNQGQRGEQAAIPLADEVADLSTSDDGDIGADEEGRELGEEPLVPIDFQPVLTEWTCDWPGRCKLTLWAGHSAQFNGGWCMCNQKGKSANVCPSCPCLIDLFLLVPIQDQYV